MSMPRKVKRPSSVTVGEFYRLHKSTLKLKLLGGEAGMERKISEPTVNRPGLALSGFFTYFAYKRVQVVGNSELSFLDTLEPAARAERFRLLCNQDIPCIVVARSHKLPPDLVKIADDAGISVLQTSMVTMKFINAATIKLEFLFAPTQLVHGCLVDVRGIGVLVQGESGTGKSESVIGLLQRGASLVADDAVRLRLIEDREILGSSPELTRNMVEIRGLGILNVAALFGVGAVRVSKRLDLIVNLVEGVKSSDLERVGMAPTKEKIMGFPVAKVDIPVAPGRDVAGLIELAALNYRLQTFGYNSAIEFDQRLLKKMADDQIG